MHFPSFWANGSHEGFNCWRWSDRSLEDARSLAVEAARRLAERFAEGTFDRAQRYAYGNRPLREPILREFKDAAGVTTAVISRNSYGCLVLNTARLMFVDVDLPEQRRASGGLFKRLFGKPDKSASASPEATALSQAQAWGQQHAGWGWRVYRTRAGLRLLATHALFEPADGVCESVFQALGADPLYRQLCRNQKCFRARLTPKPWRCGVPAHPPRWPWRSEQEEARFKAWEQEYLNASSPWATAEFIAAFGNSQVHPQVQPLLRVHDEATRAESKLPLA